MITIEINISRDGRVVATGEGQSFVYPLGIANPLPPEPKRAQRRQAAMECAAGFAAIIGVYGEFVCVEEDDLRHHWLYVMRVGAMQFGVNPG